MNIGKRELRQIYNSLMLVQENVERVKKLGVVIGKNGPGLGYNSRKS